MVVAYLQHHEGASRAQMARDLGYAASTITNVVSSMIESGLAEEYTRPNPGATGPGRRPQGLRVKVDGNFLAIEFDHDQVHVGVADQDGVIIDSGTKVVDTAASPSRAIDATVDLARRVLAKSALRLRDVRAAAVGLPGPVDIDTGIVGSSSVLPHWRDVNVIDLFRRRLGSIPVRVDNDTNLAAIGESHWGKGQGMEDFIFVKASTGLGGALMSQGELIRGVHGAAGEIGHMAIPGELTMCRCGNRGCLETVSSTAALIRQVANLYPGVTNLATLRQADKRRDTAVSRALFDMGSRLGTHLAHLCTVLDVNQVFIGGDLPQISTDYIDGARETTYRWIHPSLAASIRVEASSLGSTAGMVGAAVTARRLALRT